MDTIKAANKIIKDGLAILPDDAKADFKAQANDIFVDEAINNACGSVNKDDEKLALLTAYAVREANQMVTTLWRLELLPEDMEKDFRALPTMKEVADAYNKFEDATRAQEEEFNKQYKVLIERKREMDIFKGIINGIPANESEKRYNEFMKQQQAALGAK